MLNTVICKRQRRRRRCTPRTRIYRYRRVTISAYAFINRSLAESGARPVRYGREKRGRALAAASSPALATLRRVALRCVNAPLSQHSAFILVRARAPTHRPLYISADLNLTVAGALCVHARAFRQTSLSCLYFFFSLIPRWNNPPCGEPVSHRTRLVAVTRAVFVSS